MILAFPFGPRSLGHACDTAIAVVEEVVVVVLVVVAAAAAQLTNKVLIRPHTQCLPVVTASTVVARSPDVVLVAVVVVVVAGCGRWC